MSARKRTKGQENKPSSSSVFKESASINSNTTTTEEEVRTRAPASLWRQLAGSLKYLLLLVIVPPFINYAALQKEGAELKPLEGQLYDVGWGRKMYLMCSGKGPPTVILDAPTGMTSDVWTLVWPKLAKHSRVCVYDRAGLGFSERPLVNKSWTGSSTDPSDQYSKGKPYTVESMVDDLHRLTWASSQQPRPLILVGAELGGLVAQFYTLLFDSDVYGLVLVNPLPENLFDTDPVYWPHYWFGQLEPTYQSLQLGAALGLSRLGLLLGILKQPLAAPAPLEDSVVNRQKYLLCHPRHLSSVVDEHHFINDTFSQMKLIRIMRSIPSNISVTVMTGNYYDEQLPAPLNKAWAKAEQELISRSFPRAQHIVVNAADHRMMLTAPDVVVEQVLKMVRQWSSKQSISSQPLQHPSSLPK